MNRTVKSAFCLYNILFLCMAYPAFLCAQDNADSLIQVISSLPDDTSKVNAINQHYLAIMNHNYDLGYQLSSEALRISIENQYQYGEALSLENIGIYYWYNGYYAQAVQTFKSAIQKGNQYDDFRLLAESTNRIGLVFYYQAMYDSAMAYHMESLNYFRKMDDSLGVARIWSHVGLLYFHQSKYDQAVDYYLKSLNLYETYGTPLNQANLLNKISEVYKALGQTELIWEKQQELLNLASKAADPSNQVQFNEQIGDIYFLTSSYDSALTYFEEARRGYKEMHTNYYDFVNEKIGKILLSKGEYERALECMYKVYEIRQGKGTRIAKATVEGHIADIYLAMGDWDNAIKYYSNALKMHLEMGNSISLARIYGSIAEAYCKSGAYNVAIENALRGLEISRNISAQNSEINNLKVLSDAYLKKESYVKAYEYLSEYHTTNEQLTKGKTIQRISNLQVKYNEAKSQQEIAQLKQNEILQQSELAQRNQLMVIFIMLFLLILTVSILLYYRYRLKVESNLLLTRKNEEIEEHNVLLSKKNKEGEFLLAEIRHRIKNNLQTLSSMLSMHSRHLSPNQQSLIQESHNRVRAMALIHQRLHQDTNYAFIELESYLEELASNLIISYGRSDLKLEINIPKIIVEADSAVYIGLITNELITNSLKYAYQESEFPGMSIWVNNHDGDRVNITVKDNGVGFSGKAERDDSFGIKLISVLIEELDGTLNFVNRNGTEAMVSLRCHIMQPSREFQERA